MLWAGGEEVFSCGCVTMKIVFVQYFPGWLMGMLGAEGWWKPDFLSVVLTGKQEEKISWAAEEKNQ